jgi:hypothetical protein
VEPRCGVPPAGCGLRGAVGRGSAVARLDDAPDRVEAGELPALCESAVRTAAGDLGLDPLLFARELAQGEVGLLVTYLRAAAPEVRDVDLRARIDALLHRLTAWTAAAD